MEKDIALPCPLPPLVILSGAKGLARESVRGVERPLVCLNQRPPQRGILTMNPTGRASWCEFPFACQWEPARAGSLDSAGSFASERSCFARDDISEEDVARTLLSSKGEPRRSRKSPSHRVSPPRLSLSPRLPPQAVLLSILWSDPIP